MIVSNHLSYLDILAFGAITPCVFVAKQEVAGWPVLGFFARMAGTIFVNRASRLQVADANARIESALKAGATVLLFAEGTSSDGRTVLPFRPALLEPMIRTQCPATPAAVSYSISYGSVADEVCYWRDMTLVPHLLNLLSKQGVHANVRFGVTEAGVTSRKLSAVALREKVVNLRQAMQKTTIRAAWSEYRCRSR
jgi:1-acyl-sn-glycerol-3-phosphate acyltransferase